MLNGKLISSAGELDCEYALSSSNHFQAKLVQPLWNPDTSTLSFSHLVTKENAKHTISGTLNMTLLRDPVTKNVELSELSGSVI